MLIYLFQIEKAINGVQSKAALRRKAAVTGRTEATM